MPAFDEKSEFLAGHWKTYKAITGWEGRLADQLERRLLAMGPAVMESIGGGEWTWQREHVDQFYLSHPRWARKTANASDPFRLWIGIEGFRPDRILGSDDPPRLFLWSSSEVPESVVKEIRRALEANSRIKGTLHARASGGWYIDGKEIPMDPSRTLEEYAEFVEGELKAWVMHYANDQRLFDRFLHDNVR